MRVTLGLSVLLFATLAWGQPVTSDPPQPSGIVGSPYTQTLTVTGGTAPYRWFLSGSLLPGLTLSLSTGATVTISGIPAIPANGTLYIQTSGDVGTALLTGSSQVTGASGFAIFRYNPNGQEAVVPMQSFESSWVLAFDNTNNIATGVAISSAYAEAVTIPVTIRDDQGNQIGASTISLAAKGHTSFMLAQQYPVTAGIRGTLEFHNPKFTATIGVLGIRSPPQLTFITLPALSEGKSDETLCIFRDVRCAFSPRPQHRKRLR